MQVSSTACYASAHCQASRYDDTVVLLHHLCRLTALGPFQTLQTPSRHRHKHPDVFSMTTLVSVVQAADGDVRLDVLLRSVPSSRRQTLLLASWLQGEVAALTAAAGGWPAQCMSLPS